MLQTHPHLEESRSLQQLIKFYQSVSVTFSTSTFTTLLFVFRLQITNQIPNVSGSSLEYDQFSPNDGVTGLQSETVS